MDRFLLHGFMPFCDGQARRWLYCLAASVVLLSAPLAAQNPGNEAPAGALRLRTNRSSAEHLRSAESAAKSGRLPDILQHFEGLRREGLIPTAHGGIARNVALGEILQGLAEPLNSRLIENWAADAEREWQFWRETPDFDGLQQFCQDFGHTQAGLNGWMQLAIRLRDDSRWSLANVAWEKVATHPLASPQQRQLAIQSRKEAETWLHPFTPLQSPPESDSTATALRPASTANWTHRVSFPDSAQHRWEEWLTELRAQGVYPFAAAQPLTQGELVFRRNPMGLFACDLATGDEVWQVDVDDWSRIERTPGYLDSANFRQALLEQFDRQLAADTVLGRVSGDGKRVYAVQDPRTAIERTLAPGQWPVSASREVVREPFNRLVAFEMKTGALAWRIGGESSGPTYPLANQFFCGPPLVIDDMLYVVGQQGSELQLLVIRADRGELLWKLVLGDLPRSLGLDPARQRIACTPVLHAGRVICPTAAGALIAIDPLTRSIEWASRYGIVAREGSARSRGENTSFLPDQWWEGWRDVSLLAEGDRLALASPESEELHRVSAGSGRPVWSVPRNDGLFVLSAGDRGIVVLEPRAIRLHDWEQGQIVWRTELEEISGQGCKVGERVLVPCRSGRIHEIDLADGRLTFDHFAGRGSVEGDLGHLSRTSAGWLSSSFQRLSSWGDLQSEAEQFAAKPHADPPSEADNLKLAEHALASGRLDEAEKRLKGNTSPAAESLRRAVWLGRLRTAPETWRDVAKQLISPAGQQLSRLDVELGIAIVRAAIVQKEYQAATDWVVAQLPRAPRLGAEGVHIDQRILRPDVAMTGTLVDLLAADPQPEAPVAQTLRSTWMQAVGSNNPFALATLREQWQSLPLTEELLLSSGTAPFLGLSQLAVELLLLRAGASLPEPAATAALELLASELEASGFDIEAREYRRFAHSRSPGHEPAVESVESETSTALIWSQRSPEIERVHERNDSVHYFPVPLDVDSSPFFDRLDITIERQGRRVRFGGGGHVGTWEVKLPESPTSFRHLQQHVTAWGRGRILVLRVGFELFGLSPVDERGEPAAHVLWHLDALGTNSLAADRLRLEVTPAIPGVREDEYRVLDTFGHIVAQVGPVRSDFLCYTEKGELICIDLLTGLRRWSRSHLRPGVRLGGDETEILLWDTERRRVERLRAVDGARIDERDCALATDTVLNWSGPWVWHYSQPAGMRQLICHNLSSGTDEWTQPLSPTAVVSWLDGLHLLMVDVTGPAQVWHAPTGGVLAEIEIADLPRHIDHVATARDNRGWYVAISDRVSQQAGLQAAQLRSGYRAPFIQGPLVAIDRETFQPRWQRLLVAEPFANEQPKAPPVLLQLYKQPTDDFQSGKVSDGIVRLIDKDTGQLVLEHRGPEVIGYAAMSADAVSGVVHLALERDTFHLWYRPRPPAPAPPGWD